MSWHLWLAIRIVGIECSNVSIESPWYGIVDVWRKSFSSNELINQHKKYSLVAISGQCMAISLLFWLWSSRHNRTDHTVTNYEMVMSQNDLNKRTRDIHELVNVLTDSINWKSNVAYGQIQWNWSLDSHIYQRFVHSVHSSAYRKTAILHLVQIYSYP